MHESFICASRWLNVYVIQLNMLTFYSTFILGLPNSLFEYVVCSMLHAFLAAKFISLIAAVTKPCNFRYVHSLIYSNYFYSLFLNNQLAVFLHWFASRDPIGTSPQKDSALEDGKNCENTVVSLVFKWERKGSVKVGHCAVE